MTDATVKDIISKAKAKLDEDWESKLTAMSPKPGDAVKESDENKEKDEKEAPVKEAEDKDDDKNIKESEGEKASDTKDDSDSAENKEKEVKESDDKDADDKEKIVSSYRPEEQPATQTWTTDPWKQLSVKEDIDAMFGDAEGLSEEFKTKVETIYTAAIRAKINEAVELIEAHTAKLVEAHIAKIEADTVARADEYINIVVEEWLTENQVAIETSTRTEIAEGFLADIKTVMESWNISLPAEKVDLLDEKTKEADDLKGEVNSLTEKLIAKEKEIFDLQKDDVIVSLSEGLAATEVEKFKALTRDIDASDVAVFTEKATIVKESFFKTTKAGATQPAEKAEVINEALDSNVTKYMSAIYKQNRSE